MSPCPVSMPRRSLTNWPPLSPKMGMATAFTQCCGFLGNGPVARSCSYLRTWCTRRSWRSTRREPKQRQPPVSVVQHHCHQLHRWSSVPTGRSCLPDPGPGDWSDPVHGTCRRPVLTPACYAPRRGLLSTASLGSDRWLRLNTRPPVRWPTSCTSPETRRARKALDRGSGMGRELLYCASHEKTATRSSARWSPTTTPITWAVICSASRSKG